MVIFNPNQGQIGTIDFSETVDARTISCCIVCVKPNNTLGILRKEVCENPHCSSGIRKNLGEVKVVYLHFRRISTGLVSIPTGLGQGPEAQEVHKDQGGRCVPGDSSSFTVHRTVFHKVHGKCIYLKKKNYEF